MEGGITQDNHTAINLPNEPLKGVIRHIGGGTVPPHDQPPLVQQQTEFAADNPPMVGEAFPADLLRAATLAYGVDELDAVGVNDPQHGRSGQEALRPVVMGLQETKEPGALGQAGKQRPIVARQPAIEGRFPPPLRACKSLTVTTSLGQRCASGCLGRSASWSST